MTKKINVAPVYLNWYRLMENAVERGVNFGWAHAHKHISKPRENVIKDQIVNDVMTELSDIIQAENG